MLVGCRLLVFDVVGWRAELGRAYWDTLQVHPCRLGIHADDGPNKPSPTQLFAQTPVPPQSINSGFRCSSRSTASILLLPDTAKSLGLSCFPTSGRWRYAHQLSLLLPLDPAQCIKSVRTDNCRVARRASQASISVVHAHNNSPRFCRFSAVIGHKILLQALYQPIPR